MKVTSKTSITFPKLGWSIGAGQVKELPDDKEAQKRILAEADIEPVEGEGKVETKVNSNKK